MQGKNPPPLQQVVPGAGGVAPVYHCYFPHNYFLPVMLCKNTVTFVTYKRSRLKISSLTILCASSNTQSFLLHSRNSIFILIKQRLCDFLHLCQLHVFRKKNIVGILGRIMSCKIAVSPAAVMALWAGLIETYCKPISCPGKRDMGGRYSHQTNHVFLEYFSTLEAVISDQ